MLVNINTGKYDFINFDKSALFLTLVCAKLVPPIVCIHVVFHFWDMPVSIYEFSQQ